MKKMDEMGQSIRLRSEAWGYRFIILALSIWTLFNSWQTLANGARYSPLPGFLVCLSVCVQGLSQYVLRRRMTAGDEEYQEPNILPWAIAGAAALCAAALFSVTFLLLRVRTV